MGEIPRQFYAADINRFEETTDSYAFHGQRIGKPAMRDVYMQRFGEEGVDWKHQVREKPNGLAEGLGKIMGLELIDISTTPQAHARDIALHLAQRM